MSAKFRLFLFFLCTLLLTQCAAIPSKNLCSAPLPRPEYLVEEYSPKEAWAESGRTAKPDGSQHIEMTPQARPDSEPPLVMDYFPARGGGRRPGILVSPILGGKNKVADHFARYFSRHGYSSVVVHRPKDLTKDLHTPDQLDRQLRNAVLRDRIALDWLAKQPEVDAEALGSFGISYGGIKNVVLAGVDERLKVNVFGLAGADLATILRNSNLPNLRKMRNQVMEEQGWDEQQFEEKVRQSVRTEPLRFVPYIDSRKAMLILARMDHTVPRANGEILREALGYPETLYLPVGHYSGALLTGMIFYPYIENRALEFFDTHLNPPAEEKKE